MPHTPAAASKAVGQAPPSPIATMQAVVELVPPLASPSATDAVAVAVAVAGPQRPAAFDAFHPPPPSATTGPTFMSAIEAATSETLAIVPDVAPHAARVTIDLKTSTRPPLKQAPVFPTGGLDDDLSLQLHRFDPLLTAPTSGSGDVPQAKHAGDEALAAAFFGDAATAPAPLAPVPPPRGPVVNPFAHLPATTYSSFPNLHISLMDPAPARLPTAHSSSDLPANYLRGAGSTIMEHEPLALDAMTEQNPLSILPFQPNVSTSSTSTENDLTPGVSAPVVHALSGVPTVVIQQQQQQLLIARGFQQLHTNPVTTAITLTAAAPTVRPGQFPVALTHGQVATKPSTAGVVPGLPMSPRKVPAISGEVDEIVQASATSAGIARPLPPLYPSSQYTAKVNKPADGAPPAEPPAPSSTSSVRRTIPAALDIQPQDHGINDTRVTIGTLIPGQAGVPASGHQQLNYELESGDSDQLGQLGGSKSHSSDERRNRAAQAALANRQARAVGVVPAGGDGSGGGKGRHHTIDMSSLLGSPQAPPDLSPVTLMSTDHASVRIKRVFPQPAGIARRSDRMLTNHDGTLLNMQAMAATAGGDVVGRDHDIALDAHTNVRQEVPQPSTEGKNGSPGAQAASLNNFSSNLRWFKYLLLLGGLRQQTTALYRWYIRFSVWCCTLMCFLNIFFRTKSYRNPLFDVTLCIMHFWVSYSFERWHVFTKSHHWRLLVSIVSQSKTGNFFVHINRVGIFGLIATLFAVILVCLGWIGPIMYDVVVAYSHDKKYAFLALHGVFMILIIVPWAAACICSSVLFHMVVLAHQSDVEHFFQTTKSLLTNFSDSQGSEALEETYGWLVRLHQPVRMRLRMTCHYFNGLYSMAIATSLLLITSGIIDLNDLIVSKNLVWHNLVQDIFFVGLGLTSLYGSLWVTSNLTNYWLRFVQRINELPQYLLTHPAAHNGLVRYFEVAEVAYTVYGVPVTTRFMLGLISRSAQILFIGLLIYNWAWFPPPNGLAASIAAAQQQAG